MRLAPLTRTCRYFKTYTVLILNWGARFIYSSWTRNLLTQLTEFQRRTSFHFKKRELPFLTNTISNNSHVVYLRKRYMYCHFQLCRKHNQSEQAQPVREASKSIPTVAWQDGLSIHMLIESWGCWRWWFACFSVTDPITVNQLTSRNVYAFTKEDRWFRLFSTMTIVSVMSLQR